MAGSGRAVPAPILAAMDMDYGHELLFGTFITPAAQQPHHAVSWRESRTGPASTW
jgi:hypothetical protein